MLLKVKIVIEKLQTKKYKYWNQTDTSISVSNWS